MKIFWPVLLLIACAIPAVPHTAIRTDTDPDELLIRVIKETAKKKPDGYTRITKIGQRAGDGADMARIEFV